MKKIKFFIVLWLLNSQLVQSQESKQELQQKIDTTFATQVNHAFTLLDKSKVPYGILSDYGLEFVPLQAFNGALHDSVYTDASIIHQLYNTLLISRIVDNPNDGFITPENFDYVQKKMRRKNVLVLTGLYYNYASFKPDALAADKLTFNNGQFIDKYINGQHKFYL